MSQKVGGCLLLAVAPNGARKTKEDIATIPLTAAEIGLEAKACLDAGASMIHLHVRNSKGQHSLNVNLFEEAIEHIKEQTSEKIFIQLTSESVGKYSSEEQFAMIHALKPESVSIAIREIKNFDQLELNDHFNLMRQNEVYPQIILYNQHDLDIYKNWLEGGIIPGNAYPVLIVIGKHHVEGVFEIESLDEKIDVPASSLMFCAFGEQEYQVGQRAAKLGAHMRLGFENNTLLDDGSEAQNNAEIVKQMAGFLKEQGRELAAHQDARKIMKPDW